MIKPKGLRPGDTIGIVAPAGPVDNEELSNGIKRLESMGFKTLVGKSVFQSVRYMAGKDALRLRDFLDVYSLPHVRAVVAARGGYGTLRLMSFLEPALFHRDPKIFVGSSDLTFMILFLLKRCGMVTFHGPMVGPNFGKKKSQITEDYFTQMLCTPWAGKVSVHFPSVQILKKGRGEGVLTGGCLSLVCQSLKTPFEVETRGGILFLEDVDEAPYRVDRMLNYLKISGKLEGVRGIVFGTMEKCHPPPGAGYTLEEVILDCLADFKGPILYGFPSGHGAHNVTLPMGVRVSVDGLEKGITLLERPVQV